MATMNPCPTCGRPDTLLALGVRYDHPHRWRPWITARTQLYLCDHCEELVAVPETRDAEHTPHVRPWIQQNRAQAQAG